MKVHTTNYENTLIAIADDCPVTKAEVPPAKGEAKTVAGLQYDLLSNHPPYTFTSDDLLFRVYAHRNDLTESELEAGRTQFFSKGQPCLRASPLTKRYGWGIHSDKDGKIALVGCETPAYERLAQDDTVKVVKAMKSAR